MVADGETMVANGAASTDSDEALRSIMFTGREVGELLINALITDRMSLATGGKQFGGDRDMYKVLGYKRQLEFTDYNELYERGDIAARVIEMPPEDTWRNPPAIFEGQDDEASSSTPFAQEVDRLFRRLDAFHHMENVDVLTGIGHYGVLLIGIADGRPMDTPVEFDPTTGKAPTIAYLRGFDEQSASVEEYEVRDGNARLGLPVVYKLTFEDTTSKRVHWTRVIHVVEKPRRSAISGTPRLKKVFNRLYDLEKVVGGGAEAFWKLVYKGIALTLKEGFKPTEDPTKRAAVQEKIEAYLHDLTRFISVDGYDINEMGGESVDPSAMVDVILTIISAATGIPKRLLLGAEVGQLASTQDATNWAGRIAARRIKFAEPRILRPLIDTFISWGVISAPRNGYSFKWKPLFEIDPVEQSQVALRMAQAFAVVQGLSTDILSPTEFRGEYTSLPARSPEQEVQDATQIVKEALDDVRAQTVTEPVQED